MKILSHLTLMCGTFIIKYFSKFTNSTFEFIFMYFLEKIHKLKMITSCAYEKNNLALSDGCHVSLAHIQLKIITNVCIN